MFRSFPFLRARSIVGRLTLWYFASSFILVLFATGCLYWSLARTLSAEDHAILQNRLQTIRALFNRKSGSLDSLRRRIELEWPHWHFEKVFVRIENEKGEALAESPDISEEVIQEVFPKATPVDWDRPLVMGSVLRTQTQHSFIALSHVVQKPEMPHETFTIYLALDLDHEQKIVSDYQKKLILVLLFALFFSVFVGSRIAKSGFKPVQDIIEAARRIQSTTLHERISESHLPTELKALSRTINEMLDRLESSFERLSQFSADIAHELRTPVNNLRGEVEVALGKVRSSEDYQEILQSSLEECSRLARIIDSLLFLAQAENPDAQIKKERIPLDQELRKIIEFYEPMASEEGISIETVVEEPGAIHADRTLFQRAIGNILSNAINYTPSGGRIRVEAVNCEDSVKIIVTDNGAGIAEEHLSRIFDRFYRSDSSRTTTKMGGFGLGLSMVKSILKLHDGHVEIKSKLSHGTQAILTFAHSYDDPTCHPTCQWTGRDC